MAVEAKPSADTTSNNDYYLEIKARKGWIVPNWRELYAYRELLYFMAWRDIKVRYKQTVLGVSWAIIQPFMTMIVFTLFFGELADIPSDDVPYPIFSYAALVPWAYFSTRLTEGSTSLVTNSNLIQKVYFPRLLVPVASAVGGIVDFVLAFIVLIGMMIFFGIVPTANIIFLPFFLLLALITALGVTFWLSAMNVQFRDVRYVLPFLVQVWLFITPIAYPSSLIENEFLRTIYGLNPMTGVVEGFRWALLGVDTAPGPTILVSSVVAVLVLMGGVMYFQRMEKTFADVL